MTTQLRGFVDDILYSDMTGWVVLRLRNSTHTFRAVGNVGTIRRGETWILKGEWVTHPVHGEQFQIGSAYPVVPSSQDELVALLSGDLFPGIGPATASTLVRSYGDDLWDVLENKPLRLRDDKILTPNKAELVIQSARGLRNQWKVIQFLVEHQLPIRIAQPLVTLYQGNVLDAIQENPYRLLNFVDWSNTDRVAVELGVSESDQRRLEAGFIHCLQRYLVKGHTGVPKKALLKQASRHLHIPEHQLNDVLKEPLVTFATDDLVQLPGIASQERTVATALWQLAVKEEPLATRDWVERWLNKYELQKGIRLDQEQREAVHSAVNRRLVVITGGPGTGKTAVIDAIRLILQSLGQNVALAAPTGRSAKRIQEVTGTEAKTLHRTLGYTLKNFSFGNTDDSFDNLIVDECSMVDLRLWGAMALRKTDKTRFVLVGDADQLPPVGSGQVFNDLVRTPDFPIIRLTNIHRQASDNPIPYVSAFIKEGKVPPLSPWNGQTKGVFFVHEPDEEQGIQKVVKYAVESLQFSGFALDDVQMLCPSKTGLTGTHSVNERILEALGRNLSTSSHPFSVDDRVIQTVNNYELGDNGVMNGSTGVVVREADHELTVDFDGEEIMIKGYAVADLEHAYGITVHKSQGSQYRAVIVPLYTNSSKLLNRQLIYTAITRASDLVILVGVPEALEIAVRTDASTQRITAFPLYLSQLMSEARLYAEKTF
jgi:exodeoxyribonuclease V alpha subunit